MRDFEVPGIDTANSVPRTYSWTLPDGSKDVLLTWNSDAWASPNVGYNLIGHNVDEATLVRIAGSTEPVSDISGNTASAQPASRASRSTRPC